jgi:ABC-type Fe3+-hydroxamate transport system substrate-binding protein
VLETRFEQRGRPARIVSLYPSGTETLIALGAGDRVVGRTSWCPGSAPAMGGTKNPDLAKIRAAKPDLVLACRDENRREDVEAIEAFAPVAVADPRRVADVPEFVRRVAEIAGTEAAKAEELAVAIEGATARLAAAAKIRRRALALIWKDPWWTLGGDCYATDLLRLCGLDNVFAADPRSYFVLEDAALESARPDVLLLPDEPFRFDDSHAAALAHVAPAVLFDGSLLTWHGSRTLEALRRLPAELSSPA